MATYEKLLYDIPALQEGNQSDFEIELGDNFPLDQVTDITFQAKTKNGTLIMSKEMSKGEITLIDKLVCISFLPDETKEHSGAHKYEVDFKNLEGNPFITIGGTLTIIKEINTL